MIQYFTASSPSRPAAAQAIMCGVVGGLSAFYPQFSEVHSPRAQHEFCIRIIAKMPTLAAMAYRTSKGARGFARAAPLSAAQISSS